MLKLVCRSNVLKSLSLAEKFPNALRTLCYSTKVPSSLCPDGSLYKRISPVGDPRVSIVPILDQWVDEGKAVVPQHLRAIVKQLRLDKRFHHALQVSHWMTDRRYISLSPGDVAVRLDLICKVHGLEKAEEYFDNIPEQLKASYGALLTCYFHAKAFEKAEALMQHVRKLGIAKTTMSYNLMLNLYSKIGQYEKLDVLMEEMTEKGICQDIFTFSIRLAACAQTSDIDGMEKFLQRMEAHGVSADWSCYFIVSQGYIKAGQVDKGLEFLKKSEGLITGRSRKLQCECLLSTYASIGRKDELYNTWNLYKSSEKLYNSAYICMIAALLKLDDIVGAEKIYQEWEAGGMTYDLRVPHLLVSAYCKNGLVEKAEKIVQNAAGKGWKLFASAWECIAAGFIKRDRFPEGVEAMKKAISISSTRKPDHDTLAACLHYLKEKGDSEGINEFASLLGIPGPLPVDACERVFDTIYGSEAQSRNSSLNARLSPISPQSSYVPDFDILTFRKGLALDFCKHDP